MRRGLYAPISTHAGPFARYALVGCLTTICDVGTFWMLIALRAPLVLSITIAYLLASLVQFFGNKRFTFYDRGNELGAQILRYALLSAVMWLLTVMGVEYAIAAFHFEPLEAKLCMIPMTALLGYLATRMIVFRNP